MIQTALPSLRDPNLWRHPVIEAALRQVADPSLPADMQALADQLPSILDLLAALPQTHAHGDASPQNLLRPVGESGTLVVIDPDELAAIDSAILPGYLDGLGDEDYDVDPGLVRAGYLGGLAVRSALCALPLELLSAATGAEQHVALFATRLRLTRLMVDLAQELAGSLAWRARLDRRAQRLADSGCISLS